MNEELEKTTVESTMPANSEPKATREWGSIRDECVSGGQLNDLCDLVAEAQGVRRMNVIQMKLACGCIMFPSNIDEILL